MKNKSKKINNNDFKLYVNSVVDNSTTLKISDLPYNPQLRKKTREENTQNQKLKSNLLLGTLMFF